ncbi:hypothetical protein BC832DRAFT_52905 [Gaertneriomyces semiglobifer]|nr:hypothetical protein BC832DRAFT_52905 [Gaertneriomyces semiglobifer]
MMVVWTFKKVHSSATLSCTSRLKNSSTMIETRCMTTDATQSQSDYSGECDICFLPFVVGMPMLCVGCKLKARFEIDRTLCSCPHKCVIIKQRLPITVFNARRRRAQNVNCSLDKRLKEANVNGDRRRWKKQAERSTGSGFGRTISRSGFILCASGRAVDGPML